MKLKLSVLLIIIGLVIVGCKQKQEAPGSLPSASQSPVMGAVATHTGVVQEVLQANEYTYLNVKEAEDTLWMAVTKREIEVGATIGYALGLEMKDFTSKDLQRTFESVYFVDALSAPGQVGMGMASGASATSKKPIVEKQEMAIDPVVGGISIAELYGNTAAHGGQSVKIRGKVTKVNMAIMGKNWIHIQDGTESGGNYDLTVTTQGNAKVGDVVVVEGAITLNKDFGAGYRYDVIMEDASCTVE